MAVRLKKVKTSARPSFDVPGWERRVIDAFQAWAVLYWDDEQQGREAEEDAYHDLGELAWEWVNRNNNTVAANG